MNRNASAAMIGESIDRVLRDVVSARGTAAAERDGLDVQAWSALRTLGLIGDDAAAMSLADQAAALEAIGYAGALVPYGESEAMARWLAHRAGIPTDPCEVLSLALAEPGAVRGVHIPWGRHAARILLCYEDEAGPRVAIVHSAQLSLTHGSNLAGEPSEVCGAEGVDPDHVRKVSAGLGPKCIRKRGALLRCAAMLGAARRILELTLQYAGDRTQFGRPLAQFQVIQAYLAQMAGEVGAASAMLGTALLAAERGETQGFEEAAAAKVRMGQAAHLLGALGHQVHGAIGFTDEYALQLWTRRLWAWREEYGNESEWARELGAGMIGLGPEGYWERLTT